MAVSLPWLLGLIAVVIKPVVQALSKKFRDEIQRWITREYAEALETDNPWDDYLFTFLAKMLGVELPTE